MKTRSLFPSTALVVLASVMLATTASAQSRSAQSYIGATNGVNPLHILDFDSSAGGPTSASANVDFTGMDFAGDQQTMNFTASAESSSQYGQLHVSAQGTLTNTYYNPANPEYYNPEGDPDPANSPDAFGAVAYAFFTDTLQFGGQVQSGYRAKYVFHVHGVLSGSPVYTYLDSNIAGNEDSFTINSIQGESAADYATGSYAIGGQFAQDVNVSFTTQFLPSTLSVPSGSTVTGSGDYGSTATLAAVLLFDQNGAGVSNYTVTGTSGTTYATTLPVPEPASMAVIGFGALGLLSRRRRK